MAEQRSYTGSFDNRWKFNGKELDEETGLYYYGARFYNPSTSIWLSVDPLVEQTFEPYNYVGNNPIRFIDPTGMNKEEGGGDPLTNVMIYITSDLTIKPKKEGWDIIPAVDIVHGYNELNKKYGENSIDNLLVRSHGAPSEAGKAGVLSIGGVELKEGAPTPTDVPFDGYGLSFYTGRKGNKEALREDGFSDKEIANYEAFTNLSNKVKDKGTFIFSGCGVGSDIGFTNNIVNSLSQNKTFDFYFNIGNGGIGLGNHPDSMKCHPNKCSVKGDIARYKSSQNRDVIKDVIINNNRSKPITIVK